jgi:cold shock CspA family protein
MSLAAKLYSDRSLESAAFPNNRRSPAAWRGRIIPRRPSTPMSCQSTAPLAPMNLAMKSFCGSGISLSSVISLSVGCVEYNQRSACAGVAKVASAYRGEEVRGGADVFVHANHLVNADFLRKDQRVSFEIINDERRGKPRADRVRALEGNAK